MLKIQDSTGKTIGIVKDEDTEPTMTSVIKVKNGDKDKDESTSKDKVS